MKLKRFFSLQRLLVGFKGRLCQKGKKLTIQHKHIVVVRPAFWRLFYHILTTLSNGPIGHSTRKVLMLAKRPQLPALEHDKHI